MSPVDIDAGLTCWRCHANRFIIYTRLTGIIHYHPGTHCRRFAPVFIDPGQQSQADNEKR
jgi:hypothetical protein